MTLSTAHRVFNFSPGPAVLPVPVLEQIRDEMLSLRGCGMSVLEISHRDELFVGIVNETKARLRQLLSISDDYEILFLQGGSRLQFSMIPMNLAGGERSTTYIVTGTWGKSALGEAKKVGPTSVAWDGSAENFRSLPSDSQLKLDPTAAYVHYTSNETIQGVQFAAEPSVGNVPLVCDASSDFLSRPIAADRYGLIYACAQKNAGPAGVTVVIIRKDLLDRSRDSLPGYLNYMTHAKENSLFNTPPTFGIYVVGLVADWLLRDVGGLAAMAERNRKKAHLLYQVIDESRGFYDGHADPACRSMMNVTFRLGSDELQKAFLQEAEKLELSGLKGHRSVGGIRASIYNAMPVEGVTRLRDHMLDFLRRKG